MTQEYFDIKKAEE